MSEPKVLHEWALPADDDEATRARVLDNGDGQILLLPYEAEPAEWVTVPCQFATELAALAQRHERLREKMEYAAGRVSAEAACHPHESGASALREISDELRAALEADHER